MFLDVLPLLVYGYTPYNSKGVRTNLTSNEAKKQNQWVKTALIYLGPSYYRLSTAMINKCILSEAACLERRLGLKLNYRSQVKVLYTIRLEKWSVPCAASEEPTSPRMLCFYKSQVRTKMVYSFHIQFSNSNILRVRKRLRVYVRYELFSTLQVLSCWQVFAVLSLPSIFLWQMFKQTTVPLVQLGHSMLIIQVRIIIIPSIPFVRRKLYSDSLPKNRYRMDQTPTSTFFPIINILASLSKGSTFIYPTYPHNLHTLPPRMPI